MNTLVVHPKTDAQEIAVKAVLEALDIAFEKIEDNNLYQSPTLPPHITDEIKKSEEQFKNGQYSTHEEVKKEFQRYL